MAVIQLLACPRLDRGIHHSWARWDGWNPTMMDGRDVIWGILEAMSPGKPNLGNLERR